MPILNPALLASLLGQQQNPVSTPAPIAGDPASAAPTPAPVTPQQAPPQAPDDTQTITGWNPHHTSTLGKIADLGLMAVGIPLTPFAHKTRRENMQEAMEGFTQDPLGSIRKLARIPGMEQKAFQLYEQYSQIHGSDDEKAQRVAYYKQLQEDKARGVLSSYYGAIANSKDPEGAYKKMLPTLRNYAKARELPDELLPDTYDPTLGETVMVGGIKPETQAQLTETHDYHGKTASISQQRANQMAAYEKGRLGIEQQHEQAYESHNQAMESRTPLPRGLKPILGLPENPTPGLSKVVPTGKSADEGPANTLYRFGPDGKWHAYQKVNGQINELGTISKQRDGRWYQD